MMQLFFLALFFVFQVTEAIEKQKIVIIGCGYVGLTLGGLLANNNQKIICFDVDQEKIHNLQNNILPVYEPGLSDLIFNPFSVTFTNNQEHIKNYKLYYICTPTPTNSDNRCVLTFVYNAFDMVLKHCAHNAIVVIKSTILPGTMALLEQRIPQHLKNNIHLVYNPEFMREGSALNDMAYRNPLIIGSNSEYATKKLKKLYDTVLNSAVNTIITNCETAEIIKYAWNTYSALRITFINELAYLTKQYNADINQIIQGISLSEVLLPTSTIRPGPGFGGSCFPKDIASYTHLLEEHELFQSLAHQTITSNNACKKRLITTIKKYNPKTVTLLGLSFKANTNDIRNSTAIDIIQNLINDNISIKAYDPQAHAAMVEKFPTVTYCDSPYDAVIDSDCIVALTEWPEIKNIDMLKIASLCAKKIIIDPRYLFDQNLIKSLNFIYET